MKKLMKDTMDLTKMGVISGVGANIVTSVGGDAKGISALSSHMPTMGHLAGMEAVMRGVKKIKTK